MSVGDQAWLQEWQKARNLLCIRLDAMGDVLMSSTAMTALKEQRRDRKITLLTSASGAEAASLIPAIDEIIAYSAPWMKPSAPMAQEACVDFDMIRDLHRRKFDGAVIFTVYSQSPLPAAFFCYLAEIPLRLAHCRENPYRLLTHWVPEPEPTRLIRHEVKRQLDLVESIGAFAEDRRLQVRISSQAIRRAQLMLEQFREEPKPEEARRWAVIHPGATAPTRRYPSTSFAQVARALVSEHGFHVFFTGSGSESALIEEIQDKMGLMASRRTHSLSGRLTLEELGALLSLASVLISNNTGVVHLGAAVGTPIVDLYALTNPQHTPWRVPSRVLFKEVPCKFCYKSICPEGHQECLKGVSPDFVVSAALQLFKQGKFAFDFQEDPLCTL